MSNLALDLRPDSLGSVIGNEYVKKAVQSFIDKKNFPNVILLVGPPGTGKTTLAEIIVKEAGCDVSAIHQINGSDKNGVEDARELAEISFSTPFIGDRRAFIINECQRMTPQAMDCLLEPMEKSPALWVLTSTDPGKIVPAIKSRAAAATFELKPLTKPDIEKLCQRTGITSCGPDAVNFLWDHDIRSPREILGVIDQFLAGVPLEDAIHGSEHEPLYPEIATAVLSGNWMKTSGLLKQVKTADYRAMVAVVSAKMSWALLDEQIGPRGDAIATCLVGLGANQFADGVAYSALKGLLYKCAKSIGGAR